MDTLSLLAPVGASFMDALGHRDFERLGACFSPSPRARLLTPSAMAMPSDAAGVGDKFRQWFGEADVFDVDRTEVSVVGECLSIRYRLHLREHKVWYTCEQQAYCRVKDGLVERIDLLCSGFQPVPAPAQEGGR